MIERVCEQQEPLLGVCDVCRAREASWVTIYRIVGVSSHLYAFLCGECYDNVAQVNKAIEERVRPYAKDRPTNG